MTRYVLYHLSHCSMTKPDGWSGAPGEAAWVRLLVPKVAVALAKMDVGVLTVMGDLEDHPAFHDPKYEAFIAPHYESDTHGDHARGWFWGRATGSPTAAEDDRLGNIFHAHYKDLCARTPGPPEHADWTTINVNDYYGFRLTREVPGILVEHGIGDGADRQWLRDYLDPIAEVHAASVAEFLGIEGDDMFTDKDREDLRRVKELLEAREPLVWAARAQRGLDVEKQATKFDPTSKPKDPRI